MEFSEVGYDVIPWPPFVPGLLSAMAATELTQVRTDQTESASSKEAYVAHRRAFRKAHMRWHPDKFMHRFGSLLHEKDREKIKEKVREISQAINHSWSSIDKPK